MTQPESNRGSTNLWKKFVIGAISIQIIELILGFSLYFIYLEVTFLAGGIAYSIFGLYTYFSFIHKKRDYKMSLDLSISIFLIVTMVVVLILIEILIAPVSILGAIYMLILFIPWIGLIAVLTILSRFQRDNPPV